MPGGGGRRPRPIAALALKVRQFWALKRRLRDSQRLALDPATLTRTLSGKKLPLRAQADIRTQARLFQHLSRLRQLGLGRLLTRTSWLRQHGNPPGLSPGEPGTHGPGLSPGLPSYWTITKVKVDYTAEDLDHGRAWGLLTYKGVPEDKVREVERAMYHDWLLIPKHEEEEFKRFTPVPDTSVRYVPYPPLLRAMILAQRQKEGREAGDEPEVDLKRNRHFPKDYFKNLDSKRREEGTPV